MKIRYAKLSDAEEIAKNNILLAKETENLKIDYKTTLAGVKSLISDKTKGFYVILEDDNHIIGQSMITFEWSDWYNKNVWWLQSVYVNEKWRRKGIFTKILNEIKKKVKENNVDILRLYVINTNKKARETYKSIGMHEKPSVIYQMILS